MCERCAQEFNVIDTTVGAIQDEFQEMSDQIQLEQRWLLVQDRKAYADRGYGQARLTRLRSHLRKANIANSRSDPFT